MAKIRDKLYELVGTVIKIKTPILTGTATMLRTESFFGYPGISASHIVREDMSEWSND